MNCRSQSECSYLCTKNPTCTAFSFQAQNSECQTGKKENLFPYLGGAISDQLISVFVKGYQAVFPLQILFVYWYFNLQSNFVITNCLGRVRVNCSKFICSNLDCSTLFSKMSSARLKKCQLLDRQKYAVRVPHFVFKQLQKKMHLLEFSRRWQNFCDSKK